MPAVRDTNGRTAYVRPKKFYADRPEDFFQSDSNEYRLRVDRARRRVLEVIRYASRPLGNRGTCHEIRIDAARGDCIEQLVDYIDRVDGRRVAQARRQRGWSATLELASEYRVRSPQDIKRRRSALFGGKDIPPSHFGRKMSQAEVDRFVDLMRWLLIEEAVRIMHEQHELELVGDVWYVPVSVMDGYRLSRRQTLGSRVKQDDRSFHGRPNRDRQVRIAA